MSEKKEQKKGSIAIPFLMTVLVALVLVGGTAFFLLEKLQDSDEAPKPSGGFTQEFKPGDEYNSTLLGVFDNGTKDTDLVFVLVRTIPGELKIVSMIVPTTMQISLDGVQSSLALLYRSGGIETVKKTVEQQFGIKVDKYARFDAAAMEKLHSIMGGVTVYVPDGLPDMAAGKVGLNAEQMTKLMTYPDYSNGERYRTSFNSTVISTMLNYGMKNRLVTRLDISFNGIIDLVVSDITALDYEKNRESIVYLLENRVDPVQIRIVPGEWSESNFNMSADAGEQIRDWFEVKS